MLKVRKILFFFFWYFYVVILYGGGYGDVKKGILLLLINLFWFRIISLWVWFYFILNERRFLYLSLV